MKKPTQDLMEEHNGITVMLQILSAIDRRLKNGEKIPEDHWEKILEFLSVFVDKCHHGKEEGFLFPELTKNSIKTELVTELFAEHQTARNLATNISQNIPQYVALLTTHIEKENTQLFPVAEKQLSPDLQNRIEDEFEDLERNVIGEGKHEQYHSWLKELKSIYS